MQITPPPPPHTHTPSNTIKTTPTPSLFKQNKKQKNINKIKNKELFIFDFKNSRKLKLGPKTTRDVARHFYKKRTTFFLIKGELWTFTVLPFFSLEFQYSLTRNFVTSGREFSLQIIWKHKTFKYFLEKNNNIDHRQSPIVFNTYWLENTNKYWKFVL